MKLPNIDGMYTSMASTISNPRRCWCRECGRSVEVDAAICLRHGWPRCCGSTMTIDPPAPTEGEG